MGCWARVDQYFFPKDMASLFGKSLIVGIGAYRVIKLVLFCAVVALIAYNQTTIYHVQDEFIYLTEWGAWLTFFYLTISTANMLSHWKRDKPLWGGIWKVETVLYLTALVDEFMITIIFWSFLYREQHHTLSNLLGNLAIHALPCILLWVDSFINPIVADSFRPIIYILAIDTVYFAVNMAYSLTIKPVYTPMTFRDVMTLLFIGSSLLLGLVQFLIYKFFYRFKKSHRVEEQLTLQRESLLTDTETV